MAAVFGNERQYVVALIVPNLVDLPVLAHKLGLPDADIATYVNNERIHAFYEARIRRLQKNMASFEQIRRFVLLPAPFTMERNELTNTLKLRRATILEHYADVIAGMY
jgi:long-chain acyl-CoA synthetase